MRSSTIQFGICFIIVLLFTGCVSSSKYKKLETRLFHTVRERDEIDAKNKALKIHIVKMEESTSELKKKFEYNNQKLKQEHEAYVAENDRRERSLQGIIDSLKAEVESKSIRINKLENELNVELIGKLFFPQGSAELTKDGRNTIARIARIIKESEAHAITIVGHTDPLPPSGRLKKRYVSNWDLSTARALAVGRILQWGYAIPPQKIKIMGVGSYNPLLPEDGQDPDEANRAVEILIGPSINF